MSNDGSIQAKLWKEWLSSPSGKKCAAGTTDGKYLENRLWHAFTAGYEAAIAVCTKEAQ